MCARHGTVDHHDPDFFTALVRAAEPVGGGITMNPDGTATLMFVLPGNDGVVLFRVTSVEMDRLSDYGADTLEDTAALTRH